MKKIAGSLLVIFLSHTAFANFGGSSKGTTTANFLKLGAGARAVSMGEAYTAVTDDANSLYWNPGALTQIEKHAASLMHSAYLDSSFYDYAAYGQKLNEKSAWGAGFQYFSAGSINETDVNGNAAGSFTPNDMALAVGYARMFSGYSIGVSGKYIKSEIIDSAATEALDFGILSPTYLSDRLRLAFGISNLGGKMKFESESENIPMTVRVGSSYKVLSGWLLSMDGDFPRDNDPVLALGTEYKWKVSDTWSLATRAGYNTRTVGEVGGFTGATFGFGLDFSKLSFDYGFLPFGNVGLTHLVSFAYKF